jgi:choline-sulfatase
MADRQDVLFVVLDSLRTDRVSAYGHDRETTPALDRFAEGATTYGSAYVPAPWTLPSHCSAFTGVLPSEHGVTNGFTDRDLTLPTDHETVTERLADAGYRTGGFSNNPWVGQLSGLDRGFDRFVEWDLETTRGTPARRRDRIYSRTHSLIGRAHRQPLVLLKRRFFTENLVSRAARWVRESDGRTFTFCNLMEAHSPYYPPDWAFEALDLDPPGSLSARSLNTKLLAYVLGKRALSPGERRRVHEFLDASVRYQDREFDRLLSSLRETGRLDDALVVVCADHGKTLGEFDRRGTVPHYLRDLNVRVPLLIKWPGQTDGERVETPVELADLYGLLTGDDDLPVREGGAVVEDHLPHTASGSRSVTRWRAIADGDRKLLRCEDGREFLLAGEGLDEAVVEDADADSTALRTRLAERVEGLDVRSGAQSGTEAGLGDDVESQLEDLGYLG